MVNMTAHRSWMAGPWLAPDRGWTENVNEGARKWCSRHGRAVVEKEA